MTENPTALVIVKDLFFQTRLAGGLTNLGYSAWFVENPADLPAQAAGARLAIIDLAARRVDPFAAIADLRAGYPDLPILAFGSHKDLDARARAIAAGASRVVANSALSSDLAGVVRRLIDPPGTPSSDDEA